MTYVASCLASRTILQRYQIVAIARCNHFQVFGIHFRGVAVAVIMCGPERDKVIAKFLLSRGVERRERPRHWTVVGAERLHNPLRRERIIDMVDASSATQISNSVVQT